MTSMPQEQGTGFLQAPSRPLPPARIFAPVVLPPVPVRGPSVVVALPTKSVGVAILLTFLFGPLGMLYSTVAGGLVMIVVSFFGIFLTFGLGIFIIWPICIIWAGVAADNYNKELMAKYGRI